MIVFFLLLEAAVASTATNVVVINNNRCRDYKCSPRVCRSDGCSGCGCVDCRSDSHCGWATDRPYCSSNTCVQCLGNGHCASDTNCNSFCTSNSCVSTSRLDCTQLVNTTHCLIGQARCIECLSDSDCPSKHCRPDTNTCEACLTNLHCRSNDACNDVCLDWKCSTPVEAAVCNRTNDEVCYEWLGECRPSCLSENGTCSTGKNCNTNNGKCYNCVIDDHCGISSNETCNSHCQYLPDTIQTQCGPYSVCPLGKSCRPSLYYDHIYYCSALMVVPMLTVTVTLLLIAFF